jgi:hypothetical protein
MLHCLEGRQMVRPRFSAALILALATLLAASAAQGRPRDEVMSKAFHCASIDDDRVWLDCFYGAAQPVRAQLGLPPALAAQLALVASPPEGNGAGDPIVRDQVLGAAFDCHALVDDRQWLNCYYGAADPLRVRLGLALAAAARPQPPPKESGAAERFGLRPPVLTPPPEADNIVSSMISYSFDAAGSFTVTLANGQTWRELEGDTDHPHWTRPPQTYTVSITRGALGSYNLRVKNVAGAFKVQRVK